MTSRMYWVGNVAKSGIIGEIFDAHPGPASITIFDYGCGEGGDWPRVLADYPHVRLVGYEPHEPSARRARARLQGLQAEIHTGDAIETLNLSADCIVTFSVFEHVVDRKQFLAHAKRLLAPSGVFYLNYDDGHFRDRLDLADIGTWSPALRAFARTVISGPAAAVGQRSKYQRRVEARDADRLAAAAGFRIERVDYHNLLDLKGLAKTLPLELQEDYVRWWLAAERTLNDRFLVHLATPRYGDTANLWNQMVTRTLLLRHT
jgi:SAM-dependent methyltransferase